MALNNVILDDKRWATIVEEARLLIPSFSREWTDHNVHDPGITFLELFAWLEEMQRYRLNRTSSAIRDRFFVMAGVQLKGAQPATAVVEFVAPEISSEEHIRVPDGTPLVITGHPELVYETAGDSYLVASTIAAVETRAGRREIDRTAAEHDRPGHFDAFGTDPRPGDGLSITFARPVSAPELSIFFRAFDADLSPVIAGRLPIPSVQLRWEYSSAPDSWTTLTVLRDTTAALTLSGFVVFENPGASIHAIRATVAGGHYEIPPRLAAIRLNALEVRQIGRAAPDLEPGTGLPDQQRRLDPVPLREETPVIQVGPVGAEEDWSPVADLSASEPGSKHYTFDPATGDVLFGNGLNGFVPPKDHRIVVKPYRYTLGARGNLSAGVNWRLTAPPAASLWVGTNPVPAAGGSDAELPEDTELRARATFRKSNRAVTADDIQALAIGTPGIRVARAKALPGWSPLHPCTSSPEVVTVVVLPATRPDLDAQAASPGFLATVNRHLQGARLVASRVIVIGPEFVALSFAAKVTLKKTAVQARVRRDIEKSLREFVNPQKWPFGRNVFPSEIHQLLAGVAGVAFASQVRINGSPSEFAFSPIQLPRVERIELEIREARDV